MALSGFGSAGTRDTRVDRPDEGLPGLATVENPTANPPTRATVSSGSTDSGQVKRDTPTAVIDTSGTSGNTPDVDLRRGQIKAWWVGLRNTAVPTITGTPQSGQTLTAHPGTWEGDTVSGTSTWQWYAATSAQGAGDAALSGETNSTLVLGGGHVGKYIRVKETRTETTGDVETGSAFSAYTAVVAA